MVEALQSWVNARNEDAKKKNAKLVKDKKEPRHNENQTIEGIVKSSLEKDAQQAYFATHEPKMTDSCAPRTGGLIGEGVARHDGFVRTGNVDVELDISSSAADATIAGFMYVRMSDGKTVASHLGEDSIIAKGIRGLANITEQESRDLIDKLKKQPNDTSGGLKQVYFPEAGEYTLLTVVQPTSLLYAQTDRIADLNFAEESKAPRKARREGEASDVGYSELRDFLVMGYGGDNPQNLGKQSSAHKGKVRCFMAIPPEIAHREVKFPRVNFFNESVKIWKFKEDFKAFHRNLDTKRNNVLIRERRDRIIRFIADKIFNLIWTMRSQECGWSRREYYDCLKPSHKIWLDDTWISDRNEDNRDDFLQDMTSWFMESYEFFMGESALEFDDEDAHHVFKIIKDEEVI